DRQRRPVEERRIDHLEPAQVLIGIELDAMYDRAAPAFDDPDPGGRRPAGLGQATDRAGPDGTDEGVEEHERGVDLGGPLLEPCRGKGVAEGEGDDLTDVRSDFGEPPRCGYGPQCRAAGYDATA